VRPTYRILHGTTYDYNDDVGESHGRAHLLPREETGQSVISSSVTIDPEPDEVHEHRDYFGNRSSYYRVMTPHRTLTVTSTSLVEVTRTATPWSVLDAVRVPALGAVPDRAFDDDALRARELLLPSARVPALPEVATYAAASLTPGAPLGAALAGLLERIHTDFTYKPGATTVNTPLAEALAKRAGVCQDLAHLLIGCLRSVGLPAGYVSGYLETTPPPGKPRLFGVDASHAWASVHVADVGWIDIDPTNNQPADDRYIVVARGRDYADVPPLKGVIFTESTKSTMRVSVDVRPDELATAG